MPQSPTDLLMLFTSPTGKELSSEGALAIYGRDFKSLNGGASSSSASPDSFMKEFIARPLDYYSNYFDVTDFDFSLELDPNERSGAAGANAATSVGGSFSGWFDKKDPVRSFQKKYNVKHISGSFGKIVDSVSPIFFHHCCRGSVFQKAILVKRASGAVEARTGETSAMAYLRVEMASIRITNVSWSDGDLLTEKIQFKCREMKILYRQQAAGGRLSTDTEFLKWEWKAGNNP